MKESQKEGRAVRIANTISDSIVDGPGLRLTVFTQAAPTAAPTATTRRPTTRRGTEAELRSSSPCWTPTRCSRGLTLSGGDPFLQAAECAALARAARDRGLDVWTYTGWTYEQLLTEGDPDRLALLDATDVLVDGPFVAARKSYAALFRGSDNQRLIDLRKTGTGRPGGPVDPARPAGPLYGAGILKREERAADDHR